MSLTRLHNDDRHIAVGSLPRFIAHARDVQDDPLVADVNGAGTFLLRTGTLCSSHPGVGSMAPSLHRTSSKYIVSVPFATVASAIHMPRPLGAPELVVQREYSVPWVIPPRNSVGGQIFLRASFATITDTFIFSQHSLSASRSGLSTTLIRVPYASVADDIACIVRESTENAVMASFLIIADRRRQLTAYGYVLASDHHEPRPSLRGEAFALHRFRCCATPAPYTRVPSLVDRWERARHAQDTDNRAPDPLGDAEAAFKRLETVVVLSTPSPLPSQPNPNGEPRRVNIVFKPFPLVMSRRRHACASSARKSKGGGVAGPRIFSQAANRRRHARAPSAVDATRVEVPPLYEFGGMRTPNEFWQSRTSDQNDPLTPPTDVPAHAFALLEARASSSKNMRREWGPSPTFARPTGRWQLPQLLADAFAGREGGTISIEGA
ncbi:hypothetical protein EV121DRAFT_267849 [Schizophyllum commune]